MTDGVERPALVLADGTRIDVSTGRVVSDTVPRVPGGGVLTTERVIREVTEIKRKVADLPLPPNQLNPVALVMVYSLYGLDDHETAFSTGLTPAQVKTIKMSDTYAQLNSAIVESIMAEEGGDIRRLFHENARNAARKINSLIESDSDAIALAAAKDALDRAGHRPVDVVEHRIKREDRLEIVVRKSDAIPQPVVDATYKEIPNADD